MTQATDKHDLRELEAFWNRHIQHRFSGKALEAFVCVGDGMLSVRYVNLDNAATTKPFQAVKERVDEALDTYGSVHRGAGQHSRCTTDAYERARQHIGEFVGASPENYVIFTKNTTESVNQAAALLASEPGKVLVSDIEHSSNLLPWMKQGEIVQYRTDRQGIIDIGEIERILKEHDGKTGQERIKLLAITGSSNVTGYKPPIHNIAELVHRYGARIFVDACQLVPHERVDMRSDDDAGHLDFLAFSGHKMYAPYGAGVLIGPKDFFDKVDPYQIGGGNLPYITRNLQIKRFHNVRTHDPGSPNAIGVIAIDEAIRQLEAIGMENVYQYETALTAMAFDRLAPLSPRDQLHPPVKLHIDRSHGTVIPFTIPGKPPELVAEMLTQEYGIGVRAGSFCTYELLRKLCETTDIADDMIAEHVDAGITGSIPRILRASFSIYNRPEDAIRFVDAVEEITKKRFVDYRSRYSRDGQTGEWSVQPQLP